MVLPTEHLGCHIAWCATCVARVTNTIHSRHTKISYACIPMFIKDDVLGFDVSVYDLSTVEIPQSDVDANHEEFGF